jgi:hypothetical protein
MKQIDQTCRGASHLLGQLRAFLALGLLLGSAVLASAAAQPPYIGAFYHFTSTVGNHTSTVTSGIYGCHGWEIQLGTPSINCDEIFFQVTRGLDLHESTSSGLSSPDSWILYDSGTGGSTRYIRVKAFYDQFNPYHNSYYLSYQDSTPYSYCSEQGGSVYIYNP